MQKISASLEAVADSIDKGLALLKVEEAVRAARDLVGAALVVAKKNGQAQGLPLLEELEKELSVWQSKLSVILNEPIGKKGMAKHARFWVEKLRAIHV